MLQFLASSPDAAGLRAVAADARLARFLVQLSARMAECGQSPRRLLLRMNRRDIANHLGLAHETISRSLRLGPTSYEGSQLRSCRHPVSQSSGCRT